MSLVFGNVGVCVEGYTSESLCDLLEAHGLEDLLDIKRLSDSKPYADSMYLQSDCAGLFREFNTFNVLRGYVHYVTDMDIFLHIICVGFIDPDMANSLVGDLFSQGLIKPRYNYETY